MSHLQTITDAYDKCGMVYVIRESGGGHSFLFLTGDQRKKEFEEADVDLLCRTESVLEFDENGKLASY